MADKMLFRVAVLALIAITFKVTQGDETEAAEPKGTSNNATTGNVTALEDGGTWGVLPPSRGGVQGDDGLLPDGGETRPRVGGLLQGGIAVAALLLGARAASALTDKRGCQAAEEAQCLPFSNPWLLLELAGSSDRGGCGGRYLCELFQGHEEVSAGEELRMMNFIRRLPTKGPSSAALRLRAAAMDGLSPDLSPDPCAPHRRGCPFPREQLLGAAMQIIS